MKEAQQAVKTFLEARPIMAQHDSIPHVAKMMKGEIDEMLAEHTWGDNEPTEEEVHRITSELADVVIYCLGLGNLLGIDIEKEVIDKIKINEGRFPAELFQGEGDFETIYMNRKRKIGER